MVGLKSKSAVATRDAIRQLVENEMGQKPELLFVDNGREFRNRTVEQYLREQNIKIDSPQVLSITKAAHVERFNRSLEDLIHRHFTAKQTWKYIDQLSAMLKVYNNRGHRSLNFFTPEQAELEENQKKIYDITCQRYYELAKKKKKAKYRVKQTVYVHRPKEAFARGYQERFYKEPFEIVEVLENLPIPRYKVARLDTGRVFPRSLYEEELQPFYVKGEEFKVEKVLKERTLRDGSKQYYVKWVGFSAEHNSWIGADQFTQVYDNDN